MSFRNQNREWDQVLIIDLLSDAERRAHDISGSTASLLGKMGIDQLVMNCSRKEHVFQALKLALSWTTTKSFMIQFTAHGCPKGIGNLAGLDLVSWAELRQPLAEINTALGGDLIVNMISCEGIEGLNIDDLVDPAAPFYALIGPTRKLTFAEAKALCHKFYTKLVQDSEIPRVIADIIRESGKTLLFGRSSQALRSQTMAMKA